MTTLKHPIIIACILLTSCGIHKLEKRGIYQELNPEEYLNSINENTQIIDVRTAKEYNKSHIEGATNISYLSGDFKHMVDTIPFDKTVPVFIYCETQHRSLVAAKILAKKGFAHIIDLNKGMIYWRKLGMPYIESNID